MLDGNAGLKLDAPAVSANDQIHSLVEQRYKIESQIRSASSWFFAIAALSLVNSVVTVFGGNWHFIIGLGITTFFDALALHLGNSVANIAVFVVNIFILCIPLLFGIFARKGHKWAFIVGMVLYALDGLILLLFKDWLGVGFHLYALFMIYRGVTAIGMLEQIRQAMLASTPAPIQP